MVERGAGGAAGLHDVDVEQRVLIADDDRAVRESLARALELAGYEVVAAVDGVAVCRVLRAGGDRTPVLMLTARAGVPDRIAGLDAGADDYLPKPFAVPELLARLRALIRRLPCEPDAGPDREALRLGALRIVPAARRVWWSEAELPLSKTEFDLLELLVRNEGIVLDHAELYRRVWGPEAGVDAKNLAGYVGYLRRKLGGAGAPELIHTVRGVGYAVRRP